MESKEKRIVLLIYIILMAFFVLLGVITIYVMGISNPTYQNIMGEMYLMFLFIMLLIGVMLFIIFYAAIRATEKEEIESQKEVDEFFDTVD
jgi:uncharacterized membrane protein